MQEFLWMMIAVIIAAGLGYALWFIALVYKVGSENGHFKELMSALLVLAKTSGSIVKYSLLYVSSLAIYAPPYYISRAYNIRHSSHRATV